MDLYKCNLRSTWNRKICFSIDNVMHGKHFHFTISFLHCNLAHRFKWEFFKSYVEFQLKFVYILGGIHLTELYLNIVFSIHGWDREWNICLLMWCYCCWIILHNKCNQNSQLKWKSGQLKFFTKKVFLSLSKCSKFSKV